MRLGALTQTSIIISLAITAMATVVTYDVETIPPAALAIVALVTFSAVVFAAMLIAWAGEASQFSVSQGLALAVVALVQTLPEFFVEGGIAWLAGQDPARYLELVIANFTGANRLLSGLGWPLILFVLEIQRRRNGRKGGGITLRSEHSTEVVFMLGSSLYYTVIIIKGTLTVFDAVFLSGVFLGYLFMLGRLPSENEAPEEVLEGVPLSLVKIPNRRARSIAILALFLFSGLVFVTIVHPFVTTMERIATLLFGPLAVFFFIQWIAPFLSEFPEKVTAFHWARTIKLAPMALLNFISSSVNELTILVAVIPVVFAISSGQILPVPIASHRGEILLTMAQSIYASSSLLSLRYGLRAASILFTLWLASTIFPIFAYNNTELLNLGRYLVSSIFLILAGLEVVLHRGHITVFREFRHTMRQYVARKASP